MLVSTVIATMLLGGCGFTQEPQPEDQAQNREEESQSAEEESLAEVFEEESQSVAEEEEVSEENVSNTGSDGGAQGYFTTTDIYGNEVSQQIFANAELTVLNVWATYCGPCINEMPYLGELADEYDSTQVQIVGIPMDAMNAEYVEYAIQLVNQTEADYPHLLLNQELYDWGLTEIQYVPTTFFVNQEGEIIDSVVGSMSKEDWKELIDSKLASL